MCIDPGSGGAKYTAPQALEPMKERAKISAPMIAKVKITSGFAPPRIWHLGGMPLWIDVLLGVESEFSAHACMMLPERRTSS
jgi:hypothetical protein